MSGSLAREALTIFAGGDEKGGLIAYGLSERGAWRDADFPAHAWPDQPTPEVVDLHGDAWRVRGWEVPVIAWPTGSEFRTVVSRTLDALIRGACRVAWIGAEGIPFGDPPALFDPDCMSGGVLAWMTDDGRFDCPLDPDQVLTPLSDGELLSLGSHAQGLADGSGSET